MQPQLASNDMAAGQCAAAEVQQFQWDRLPDMPTARCYTAGAYHKGKLYAIGEDTGVVHYLSVLNNFNVHDFHALLPAVAQVAVITLVLQWTWPRCLTSPRGSG